MRKIFKYFAETKSELSRVTWPKGASVIKLTVVVLVVSAVVGLYVGALDLAFTKILEITLKI